MVKSVVNLVSCTLSVDVDFPGNVIGDYNRPGNLECQMQSFVGWQQRFVHC